MQTADIATIKSLIREALPRATDEEVSGLVAKGGGRVIERRQRRPAGTVRHAGHACTQLDASKRSSAA